MMLRVLPKILLPLIMLPLVFIGGCGTKDSIDPIYSSEKLQLKDANIQYWSDIEATEVEPSTMRKITEALLRFFPVVNQLIIFPMNLVNTVFPNLPSTSHPQLPKDGEWNDPKLLRAMRSIRIGAGFIRITPESLRKNYVPEKCYFTFRCAFKNECNCEDISFDEFLSEVRVYLIFKDLKPEYRDQLKQQNKKPIPASNRWSPKSLWDSSRGAHVADELEMADLPGMERIQDDRIIPRNLLDAIDSKVADDYVPLAEQPEILLATSDINTSYNPADRTMHFNVSDVNLRPYMDRYSNFDIKLVAVGKYPKRKVYIDGRLRIDLVLRLEDQ